MRKFTPKRIFIPLFYALAYGYYIWLRYQHIQKIREPREFYDTIEFLNVATHPITSPAFWIASRPPVIPLFFKLTGSDPGQIMAAQFWISILAWGVLAVTLALVIRNSWLAPVGFLGVLGFSLTQNIILWDSLILSDSLSMSLLALFIAASLRLIQKWEIQRFLFFAAVSILLAMVRDTFAYFLLMAGAALLVFLFFTEKRTRVLTVSGLLFILFLLVNTLSSLGMRWYMPFMMTMGLRILPNQEYVDYFDARGMPISPALMDRAGKPIQADGIAMYYDPDLNAFRQWVKANGQKEFIRFLWFFKADTLQNPLRDAEVVFNPDVYYYAATGYEAIIKNERINELLFPFRFGLLASVLANGIALILLFPALKDRNALWFAPLALILLSYPQAVLVWNADANDIARHSIYHVVMLRLGFWLLILFAVDHYSMQIKPLIDRKKSYA